MKTEFDYIVVGAGSAGCVLANRLSENGKYEVAVIEAGGSDKHHWVSIPLGIGKMMTNPRFAWEYWTDPENSMQGQKIYWPKGRMLGGSSSINGMIFARGEPARYDEWCEAGNDGWGWDDMLPYFKKLEDAPGFASSNRATGGPIPCTYGVVRDPISKSFIDAASDIGIPRTDDYNGDRADGVGYLQFNIKNGKRVSTANGYLYPAMNRPNLSVMSETPCEKVLFDGKRATGVRIQHKGMVHDLKARREVILSAGPIISPKLLELSGIGNPELLKQHGIDVLQALPGVGENVVDHLHTRFNYKVNKKITLNDLFIQKWRGARALMQYLLTRKGLLATTSLIAHAMTKSDPSEPYADLKLQVSLYSAAERYLDNDSGVPTDDFSGIGLGAFVIYPKSRGHVHIQSADPRKDPSMNANYFSDEEDVAKALKGMRLLRQIATHPEMSRHVVEETEPGFSYDSDDEIIDFMKRTGQTSWHPISSCRMGSGPMDVVDSRLRVHGIEGLRVIDSSIFPSMPATNTNIPTIATGEKGAAMILNDAK